MPSLMEQAVVDADKLREAAMRNAENSILEKYSKDIKGALKTILEQAPPMPGMEEEMPMPPEAGMMPPGPMPGMAPPGPDMAAEAGIPLAATGGEKLCPCPDVEATVPITINLDDLIDVADMIATDEAPVAPEMMGAPPMDPMMMAQPPMDPMMMDQQQMMMENQMIDLEGLLYEEDDEDPFPERPDHTEYFGGTGGLTGVTPESPGEVEEFTPGDWLTRIGKSAAAGGAAGAGIAAATGAGLTAPIGGIGVLAGVPGWIVGALGGAVTGVLSSAYTDIYNDRDAYDAAVTQFKADKDAYWDKHGSKDDPEPGPEPGPGPGPSPTPDTELEIDKDSGTDPEAPPVPKVDDYFDADGNYKSVMGHIPGSSAWMRESTGLKIYMAKQRLEAGDMSAVGALKRLDMELRTIPRETKIDRVIARQKRKSDRATQRIMSKKARQQGRGERRARRRAARAMRRGDFAGIAGGPSIFPQAQLQEGNDNMIDINEEELASIIEELVVDMSPDTVRSGWAGLPESEKDYAEELELARRTSTEEKEKQEAIQDAVKDLSEKNDRLTKYSEELSSVAKQLKEKLEDVSLQNAKLFYINRTLGDASLNGRQKDKIAESIQSAVSVEEAKVIYETLQSAVPKSPSERRGKNTLSEAISRPSAILPRRKSGASDREMVFRDRMKILAGIK